MNQVIDALTAQQGGYAADIAKFLEIAQRAYDLGIILQLHSHEEGDSRTFSIHMIYRDGEDTYHEKVNADGTTDGWQHIVPEPLE